MKTQRISSTDRSIQLSLIRVLACAGIVVLHTVFAANEYFIDSVTPAQNLASRIAEDNMMWTVPLFLMVTGALQLDTSRELTWKKLFRKYVNRVLGALIVFSVLFRLFDIIMDGEAFSLYSLLAVSLREFITGKGWGHLWYLYLLLGIYMLLPFFRMVISRCSDRDLLYLACIYCVFNSVIPCVEGFGINIAFYISESLIYPLYLLLGYMLREKRLKLTLPAAAVMLAVSTAGIAALDVLKYSGGAEVPSVFFGYSSPLVIMQSAGLFALMISAEDKSLASVRRAVSAVDVHTFGIYLIHMVFVRLLFKYMRFDPYQEPAALLLALCVAAFFALSLAAAFILRKAPVFRKIL